MRVKEEIEKAGLKQYSKNKDHGIWSYHFMEKVKAMTDFLLQGSKITADGDLSHEIKRHLLRHLIILRVFFSYRERSSHFKYFSLTIVKQAEVFRCSCDSFTPLSNTYYLKVLIFVT